MISLNKLGLALMLFVIALNVGFKYDDPVILIITTTIMAVGIILYTLRFDK